MAKRRLTLVVALALALGVAPVVLGDAGVSVGFDLLVTDAGGRAVTDLQPAEIEIQEDGDVRSVGELQLGASREPRVFGIYLDEYHVGREATERVQRAVTTFIEHELAPGDRAVVMKPLDSLLKIHFDDDRAALVAAVGSFEGRRGDYAPTTPFEERFVARSPGVVEQTRAQVSWSAIAALAESLGRAGEGRKTLIVVSEGIEAVSRGRRLGGPGRRIVERLANRGRVAVYALDPSRPVPGAETEQPVDPSDSSDDSLAGLATDTNGRAARGELEMALQAAASDAQAYYWVSYDASHEGDGRFHRVAISVKRPDVTVRARRGYWARSAALERIIAEGAEPAAPLPIAEPYHASPLITPWFGFSRGANGSTRVTFVWEPADRVPGSRSRLSEPSRILLEALAPDGSTVFEGAVLPVGPGNQVVDGAAARAVFDAPPGRLNLRMSVLGGAGTEELDRDVRSISVRPIDGVVTMGSAGILRSSTARDWRRLVGDPDAAPSAVREFRRTERLLIRFPVYAEGPIQTVARLLGPDGRPLRELDVEVGLGGPGSYQADLRLASLAQGDYAVELIATAPAGQARDLIRFRVTY